MQKLKRDMLIFLSPEDEEGRYKVFDKSGNTILDSNEDYHIYFKDIQFKSEGYIVATYLGETEGRLLDEYCRRVEFNRQDGWNADDGDRPSSARLASVNNGQKLVIIQ